MYKEESYSIYSFNIYGYPINPIHATVQDFFNPVFGIDPSQVTSTCVG